MGLMIGTPEAIEAGSYENQCKNWLSNICLCVGKSIGNATGTGDFPLALAQCANLLLCPAAMNANNMYRLYSLAHARLGYDNYMEPFGHGNRSTGSMQVECPFTGPCTECLVYRHLKNQQNALGPVPPTLELHQATGLGGCFSPPPSEWKGTTYGCFSQDLSGCLMFFPGVLCCCIPPCMAICDIGQRIGTPEAIEFTSFKGQCMGFWANVFFCCYCYYPMYFGTNYGTNVLEMTKVRARTTPCANLNGNPDTSNPN